MHAVRVHEFGPPRRLSFDEIPDPVAGPGQVVVEVGAVAANYVDLLVVSGRYQFLPPRPFTPGKLPAGTVTAVGEGVSTLAVGDRVLTTAEEGGYAEKALAEAAGCYRIPDGMSFPQAASVALAFDTAWFALRERARLQPGETVLVLGATGAVGTAAVQLAKAFGARVVAGISSPGREAAVREAGADAVVFLDRDDIRDSLREQVRQATGGQDVDVVVDPLGDRFFEAALRALAWCGRLVVVGFAAGAIPTVKANYLLVKNIEVSGLQVSDYRKKRPARMAECFADLFGLFERGIIKAPPTTTMPLAGYADALQALEERRAGGRIVLVPGGR